jgi:hypothetical protein
MKTGALAQAPIGFPRAVVAQKEVWSVARKIVCHVRASIPSKRRADAPLVPQPPFPMPVEAERGGRAMALLLQVVENADAELVRRVILVDR